MADNPFQKELTKRANPFRQRLQSAEPVPRETPSTAEALALGAGQGLSFGWLDDLMNLNPWAPGAGDRYRERTEAVREARPKTTLAGELAGGIATGAAGGAKALAGAAGRHGLRRLAGVGATEGSVYGAGESDKGSLAETLADTSIGAVAGGVTGGAIPAIGGAVRKGAKYLNPKDPLNATERASRTVAQDIEQSGLSPQQIQQRLADNPNLTIADLSPQLNQRLSAASRNSPDLARRARGQLEARDAAQPERFNKALTKALGDDLPSRETISATQQKTREAARVLYDEAYAGTIEPTDGMRAVLDTPSGKSALRQALTRTGDKLDDDLPIIVDPETGARQLDLSRPQAWDQISRVLGDRIQTLRGRQPEKARDLIRLREAVLEGLDEQSPSIKQARALWRSDRADEEALEVGRKALTAPTADIRETVGAMSASEQTHWKLGVFEKVDDLISRKGNESYGTSITTIFRPKKVQDALKLAFNDDESFNTFMRTLDDEKAMEETWKRIRLRSLLDDDGSVMGRFGTAAASGSGLQFNAGMLPALSNMIQAPGRERRNRLIGDTLLGRNPENLAMVLARRERSPRIPQGSGVGGASALAAIMAGQ